MGKLSETELKKLIQGGETNTVEFKVAAPRATEMAERLCDMANVQGGLVIIGVKDSLLKGMLKISILLSMQSNTGWTCLPAGY